MDENRWFALMAQLGLRENRDQWRALQSAYAEKHRHYHTAEHISACLQHLNIVGHFAEHRTEVELALWFHDAIYKPRSSTNELDSANWCSEFLQSNNVEPSVIERIHQLIMITCHNAVPATNDEQLLVDIDLAILGAPEDVYWQFETNVRKEYQWVPGFIFRAKRKEILQGFLDRYRIYHHNYFYDLLERRARENLAAAISRL